MRAHTVMMSIAASGLAACAVPPDQPDAVVRDSAGVTIVENAGIGQATWRVTPALVIGTADGNADYTFGRVADAAPGPDGSIYVLDQLAQQVRVFDREGTYLRSLGRAGQGPGELSRFATDVLVGGDTAFVPDFAQARINVFPPAADPQTIRVPPQPAGRSWFRRNDGGYLLRGLTTSRDEQGMFRFWDALLSLDATGTVLDTLFVFDYASTSIGSRENLLVPLIVNSPSWARLGDGRIAWTALDQEAVFVHRADGTLERIIRHEGWRRRQVSDADRQAMIELLRLKLEMLGGDASAADGSNVTAPEYFPTVTGVRAGPENTLWVQRMGTVDGIDPMAINAPDRSDWLGSPTWEVYDAEGRFIGPVQLPARFRITRITDDAVYGVSKDASDVERVHRLVLER